MLNVLHLGLGEIGKASIRAMMAQGREVRLVGVVDRAAGLVGRDLREVMAGDGVPGVRVAGSIGEALRGLGGKRVDVATMTTGSRTVDVFATVEELMRAGISVVSTCEELAFPWLRAKKLANALDRRAKKAGVTILGTGVNPGFAMDAFALVCSGVCAAVESIRIVRSLDASKRREQLQKKIGAGMEAAAVRALIRKKAIGHVGLGESCALLAAGLGWELVEVREKFTAIVAEEAVASEYFRVKAGQVRGLHMVAQAWVRSAGGRAQKKITLDLTMALGAENFDEIRIVQPAPFPAVTVRATTGFAGDPSTAALLVNAARLAPGLEAGMRTMMDVLRIRSVGV